MSIWPHVRNTSLSQAKFTRCVRAIWRNAGLLPDLRICIVAWLPSNKVATTFRSNTMSHKWSAGNPSRRTAALAAAISASGELCDTHVCFLDTPFNGKKMFGPVKAIKIPMVDFDDSLSPAKSASL